MADTSSVTPHTTSSTNASSSRIVTDRYEPRIVTLDPWLEVVFAAATGQQTVKQFIDQLRSQYPNGAPPELDKQTKDFIVKLHEQGIIQLMDKPKPLPYYLNGPKSELDMDKATSLMQADGFILVR